MLVEFSVANHRCFRERVTLSLEAEPRLSERDKTVDERNIARTPEGDFLRVVGIYGANASGKSNLLGAVGMLRALVLDSARHGQVGDALPVEPFRLDPQTVGAPSEFEIVFVQDHEQFRYGVAASRTRIEREWLYVHSGDAEEQLGFERDHDAYEGGPAWPRDESLESKTRPGALHLSVSAAFNHPRATTMLGWFRRAKIIENTPSFWITQRLLRDKNSGATIRELVRRLDFGIDDVRLGKILWTARDVVALASFADARTDADGYDESDDVTRPSTRRVVTVRNGVEFDLERDESAGTIKALGLAGPLVDALAHGDVVFVDELDARLHTLLAQQLVELFQDPRTNPHDAQLIFASHDTNLLTRSLFRRDQLWFVEKSRKTHASDLYSLAELRLEDGKGVRNDARYESDYLRGKYGAIPFFGSLGALLGESLDDDEA